MDTIVETRDVLVSNANDAESDWFEEYLRVMNKAECKTLLAVNPPLARLPPWSLSSPVLLEAMRKDAAFVPRWAVTQQKHHHQHQKVNMIFRKDPFFHGQNNEDQLVKIAYVLGTEPLFIYLRKYGLPLDPTLGVAIGKYVY